jgi:hypothetical protein
VEKKFVKLEDFLEMIYNSEIFMDGEEEKVININTNINKIFN